METQTKKSTYNSEAQKKYNEKRKKLAVNISLEDAEKIQQHYTARGFSSANSYLLHLIRADMAADTPDKD